MVDMAKYGLEGFFKIGQSLTGYVVAYFYNPITKEHRSKCVRDWDYADCSRDIDELYYMPVNEDVRRQYNRDNGVISIGDTVKVVKGRKIPKGTVAIVEEIKPWYDCYGRRQATYLYFTDGTRTNENNCVLV